MDSSDCKLFKKFESIYGLWKIIDTSPFTKDELDQILRIVIVDGHFSIAAHIILYCGGDDWSSVYMPISKQSFKYKAGDVLDPHACSILTLERDGATTKRLECRVSPIRHIGKI